MSRAATALLALGALGACRCDESPAGGPAKVIPGAGPAELVFVGDIMPARGSELRARAAAGDRWADWLFAEFAPTLAKADVAFGNFECAITTRGEARDKDYTMRVPAEAADAMARAGFDVLSLANNHILDFGEIGAADTLRELRRVGIVPLGLRAGGERRQEAALLDVHGMDIAFLAYSQHIPRSFKGLYPAPFPANEKAIAADVRRARARGAAHVVASIHAGREYSLRPVARQRALARAALDAGATLVVMHHTHTPQPHEVDVARGRAVAFGLGNFVFDLQDPWKVYRVQRALLWRVRLGRTIESAVLEPVSLGKENRPRPGDFDTRSFMEPWRPAGEPVWDLEQALPRAVVERTDGDATIACDRWIDRSEQGETSLEGYWKCGEGLGRAVGRSADLSAGVWRSTVRVDPRPGPVRLRFDQVPAGDAIVGYAGLSDWAVTERDGAAVAVDFALGGAPLGRVDVPNEAGWREFRLPVAGRAPGPLVISVSSEKGARRHAGLGAWIVREGAHR